MLTTKVITPRQGESYYAKENYYSAEESVEHSQWAGKGAEELGLKGKVKPKDFKKLLYGELPGGDPFRTKKKERQGYKERAGLDCTFSAPKSVSILALVAGDKRLEEAHREAVLRTLAIIERDYATTRAKRHGEVQVVNTGNLVVGQFHHDTSRELDPHLHTHCVLLNMTQHNGRWYSLRNDDIHANKKLLGMIYQNELAMQVKNLGYEIEPKEHGQFEVKGFTTEQLESFSKRRQQIKAQLGEETTWKQREQIWDKTRLAKGEPIPRAELQNYWKKEMADLEVAYPQTSQEKPSEPKLSVENAVSEAIEHCSERTVAFKPEAIQKFVLNEVGNYRQQDLEQAIATDNELIHLDGRVTTQTALMRELATIRLMKDGNGQVSAIASPEALHSRAAEQELTEGQQNALSLATTSEDQFVAWQGKAGAGKTHALNEFKKIAQEQGYAVKGFAPSAKAAKVLKKELGIETTTVARHLVSKPLQEKVQPPSIWIVDEAGLLGAKNALALLQKATEEQARVLLVGDTRQLSSVEAGNPFKSLQQAGMTTAHLNQSLRQKTQDLKQAVELLSEGQTAQGIEILDASGRIEESEDVEDRAKRIAQDYLQLSPSEREQTLIIAGTHREREAILHRIREGLKQEGSLGEAASVERLQSKNLTNVQKKYAHYYQQGDVVVPLANYKRLGLEKGKPYRVESAAKDSLSLTDEAGTQYKVDPVWFKHKEVYQALETEIAVGDRLRWGKNDKELNRSPLFDSLPDETKWSAVKDYLVNKRGLPENLVDQLHKRGKVYADSQQNAVFLRQNLEGEPTGVSLKKTDKDIQFKELATGTQPNQGWFSVTKGEGELKRIVLTESLIDTLSAAAIAQKPEKTMFLSTDESGSVPTQWLKEQSHRGVQILAAHNRDRAGEYFAWSVAKDLPEVERVTPKAKNWNDQLLKGEHPPKPEPQVWKRVAIALGKSSVYVARIEEVTANITDFSPLSQEARQEMQSDFRAYQEITDNLWQWHRAAREQERSEGYLKQISEIALEFHSPNAPAPLSKVATRTMHYALFDQELRAQYLNLKAQVQKNQKLQKASLETIDTAVASLVIQERRNTQDHGKTFEQVSNVLSQSEQVRTWRQALPEGEYLERAKQYVDQIYGQANELSNGVSKKQEERGSALEL